MMKSTVLTTTVALLLTASAPAVRAADGDDATSGAPHVKIIESPRIVMEPAQADSAQELKRPASLPVLYASLAGLQAYDGYSTLHGVGGGANETNPFVGGLARQPAAFWTVKAVSTVATIYFAEQLWRQHHRTQAVVLMIVTNGAMGAIAARNGSILSRR
jgi:hypothetical protein